MGTTEIDTGTSQRSHARASPRTIVFAGGGSGGHLSPGLAVAEAVRDIDPTIESLFICSERAIDREMLTGAGVRFEPIPAAPFSLRPMALLRVLRALPRATRRSRDLLERTNACAVLALGGFVSVPVARAARACGVPLALLNLDAVAGRANRLVARWATTIFSAPPGDGLPNRARELVSVPVRRAARAPAPVSECRERLGLEPARQTLVITGASQGSTSLNEALPAIVAEHAALFAMWQVLHLCGAAEEERVESLRKRYESAGVRAVVRPFLHEIGLAWGAASLAVSRAGASSVAEVALNRVPAIFVPFPHHRDQHQRRNSEPLTRAGSALVAHDPLRPNTGDPSLEDALLSLVRQPEQLARLAANANAMRVDDAAARIAATLCSLA